MNSYLLKNNNFALKHQLLLVKLAGYYKHMIAIKPFWLYSCFNEEFKRWVLTGVGAQQRRLPCFWS